MGEGDWTNVIIPGDVTSPGFTHMRSYLISGLLPESEYECLVQVSCDWSASHNTEL